MSYATEADLIAAFGESELVQLTDRAQPPAGEIDSAVLAAAIAEAEGVVDGYVGSAYALPLPNVPTVLRGATCAIARWKLYGGAIPEEVQKRYDEALKLLLSIAKGDFSLDAPTTAASTATAGSAELQAPGRVFSRGSMIGL